MKKLILLLVASFCSVLLYAQHPALDPGKKPGRLPAPGLKLPEPADLRVEEFSLVSVTRDEVGKTINIQVLVRIKNFGSVRTGGFRTDAYIKSPAGTGNQKELTVTLPAGALNPGASFIKVFTYREAMGSFRPGPFDFWIRADAGNNVPESNENNNSSTVIQVVCPAR